MTACMPCSFGLLQHARSEADADATGPVGVTVTDRYIPLVTAACGTRVARPAGTTKLAPGGDGFELAHRVRPVLGDHCRVGKPRCGAAGLRWLRYTKGVEKLTGVAEGCRGPREIAHLGGFTEAAPWIRHGGEECMEFSLASLISKK
jgi:hypothetical protein